jgi:hypothetical protein
MTSRLKAILEAIQPAKEDISQTQFLASNVPGFNGHYVAWNVGGAPCLLIETSNNGFHAPLKLSALEVQFCIPCDVVLANGQREKRRLSVVTCTSADDNVRDYFMHLMDTVIQIVGERPTLGVVADAIGKLVEILQHLTKPPSRSVIGLFAEVMIIANSRDPVMCVSAWRANAEDRFDFALGDARLEIKATSDRIRAHYFSLEQCTPPRGTHAAIASMFVEQNGAGQSLSELIDEAANRLEGHAQAHVKLRAVIANSLGAALPAALQMRFDDALARSTLIFFSADDVPAIRPPVPGGVSAVRFRSDLTGIRPVAVEQLVVICPVLGQLLPSEHLS